MRGTLYKTKLNHFKHFRLNKETKADTAVSCSPISLYRSDVFLTITSSKHTKRKTVNVSSIHGVSEQKELPALFTGDPQGL